MTKDVFVSISGMHEEIAETPAVERDEAEAIEVVTPGSYYFRNEKHYIVYDEAVEGSSEMIRNRIKITGTGCVEIVKSGLSDSHMIFEKNKKNSTYYRTPYGQMLLDVNTRELEIQVTEDEIDVAYGGLQDQNEYHVPQQWKFFRVRMSEWHGKDKDR